MYSYSTRGTCSKQINFDVVDGLVRDVKFIGGCRGNLQAVAKLVEGKPVDEVIALLSGIKCQGNTSCGDQLAQALIKYKEKQS